LAAAPPLTMPSPLTPQDVSDAVQSICGVALEWLYQPDEKGNEYAKSVRLSDIDQAKCGMFRINVYSQPPTDPPAAVTWLQADAGGNSFWVALSSYANVELIWSTPAQVLDETWHQLDSALRTLSSRS
jgi:hypothetical protein